MKRIGLYKVEYDFSKYVRQDNSPTYAEYLGYLSSRDLYPDFTPISFRDFSRELLAGKGRKVYS